MHLKAVLIESNACGASFSGEAVEAPQRRGTERRSLRLSAVTTSPSNRETLVVIRDISTGGLLMEAKPDALSKDDWVEISVPEKGLVRVRVAWQSGHFYGCQFSEPVPEGAISAALLQSDPAPIEDNMATATQDEAPFRGRSQGFNPEMNFSVAVVLALALWALIGAAVYFFDW